MLNSARRGYLPLRKRFVQRPSGEPVRSSVLADLVSGHHQRPLELLLLFHALLPILEGSPLALGTWARVMSCGSPCSTTAVTRAFDTLCSDQFKLLQRVEGGRTPIYLPLMEDGRGGVWSRPGIDAEDGPGYFTLPHAYWHQGWAERLKVPGKAMLLILLSETQSPTKTSFSMAVERAQEWYGISERTAERGYTELTRAGLMLTASRRWPIADTRPAAARSTTGALDRPFRTPERALLQKFAMAAARKGVDATSTTSTATPASTQQLGDARDATRATAS